LAVYTIVSMMHSHTNGKFCLARQYKLKLCHYFRTLSHEFQQLKAYSLQAQKLFFYTFKNF